MLIPTIALGSLLAVAANGTEVTVYNQGFGFVKEVRTLQLKQGRQQIAVSDVASQIDPTSVAIKSLTAPDAFSILEQNYQYDLISPEAILNKSVGQKVRLIRTIGNTRDVLEGTLISSPTSVVGTPGGGNINTYNGLVIRADDGRIILNPTGEIEVKSVPPGLISQPTLLWDLEANKAGEQPVQVSYITNGMNWNADYVMTLDGLGKADLQGWVTINNQSGATFNDAKLKLLAGEVNRPAPMAETMAFGGRAGGGVAKRQFNEEGLFEYHLYTLDRPATVRQKEIKQLSLLEGHEIPVTKKLIVDAMRDFGRWFPQEGEVGTGDIKPQVRIEFTNDEKSNLGMPLPAGRFRIYQRDKSGSTQMLGEDRISHTPRNEKLSLVVGRAFDVVATRKRLNFQVISSNHYREQYEVEVRNRKEVPETVYVLERHWGDWNILEKSQTFEKLDANTIQFVMKLKPNEVAKVSYTVDTKW